MPPLSVHVQLATDAKIGADNDTVSRKIRVFALQDRQTPDKGYFAWELAREGLQSCPDWALLLAKQYDSNALVVMFGANAKSVILVNGAPLQHDVSSLPHIQLDVSIAPPNALELLAENQTIYGEYGGLSPTDVGTWVVTY